MVAKIPGAGIGEDANSTSLTLKNLATADNSTFTLNLQTAEADIAQDDVLGKINFQAPAEGTGTDANLVAAGIQAVSEGDFSSSSNATGLQFLTGNSAAATAKMVLTSGGSGNEGRLGVGTTHPASGAGLDAFIEVQGGDPGIVLRDDTASDAVELYGAGGTFVVYTGSADALKIDSTGAVTKPLQPAFHAKLSSNMLDMSTGDVDIAFATEVFDQNADYNTSNYTFTAPVQGRYFFQVNLELSNIDNANDYMRFKIITSNRTIYQGIWAPDKVFSSDGGYYSMHASGLFDMDASDTCKMQYQLNTGAAQTDTLGEANCTFTGFLAC